VRAINVKYALRIEVRSLVGERVAKFFLDVFVALFVIIDPAGTVPVFPGLTKGRSDRGRNRLAWQAAIVAFGRDRGIRTFRPAMRFAGVVRLLAGSGVELVTRWPACCWPPSPATPWRIPRSPSPIARDRPGRRCGRKVDGSGTREGLGG
jgi:hypothetical protein